MCAKLSAQQRGIFTQLVGILRAGVKHFSKGLLERLISWLFLHFPRVSPINVTSIPLWTRLEENGLIWWTRGTPLHPNWSQTFCFNSTYFSWENGRGETAKSTAISLSYPLPPSTAEGITKALFCRGVCWKGSAVNVPPWLSPSAGEQPVDVSICPHPCLYLSVSTTNIWILWFVFPLDWSNFLLIKTRKLKMPSALSPELWI